MPGKPLSKRNDTAENKELRRLSRAELLELLLEQTKRNAALEARIAELEEALSDRELTVERAGSLAEAALGINKVFEAADAAAQQYVENVKRLTLDKLKRYEADQEDNSIPD